MKLRECDHRPAGLQLDDAAREHDDRRLRTSGIDLRYQGREAQVRVAQARQVFSPMA